MLTNLAIWYLRLKKASVLINYKLTDGEIQQLGRNGYTYDCDFNKTIMKLSDGSIFDVPEGKFYVERTINTDSLQ